jgi:putative oxidoreductase
MKSLALLILRLVVGGVYVLHGIPKLMGGPGKGEALPDDVKQYLGPQFVEFMEKGGIEQTAGMLDSVGIPNPKPMAWTVGLTEFLGGLCLIVGIKTRPASLALTGVQAVAIRRVHLQQGLVGGYEFNAVLAASTLALAFAGAGKLAKD